MEVLTEEWAQRQQYTPVAPQLDNLSKEFENTKKEMIDAITTNGNDQVVEIANKLIKIDGNIKRGHYEIGYTQLYAKYDEIYEILNKLIVSNDIKNFKIKKHDYRLKLDLMHGTNFGSDHLFPKLLLISDEQIPSPFETTFGNEQEMCNLCIGICVKYGTYEIFVNKYTYQIFAGSPCAFKQDENSAHERMNTIEDLINYIKTTKI